MSQRNTQKYKAYPLAITMWDFSWLERRWEGGGYEDWDKALDDLKERGYDAVRIDAFPHLLWANAYKEWTLIPVWDQQLWGSPAINKVKILPNLIEFISKCKERNICVALSSWFREDVDNTRMKITSPEIMADIWLETLSVIKENNLLDIIIYVDLCNEWPLHLWAPFFNESASMLWSAKSSISWMHQSIELIKNQYPELPLCYSFDNDEVELYSNEDTSYLDLFEHHIWMSKENNEEYFKKVGYNYERFSSIGYNNLVEKGEKVYRENVNYWQILLTQKINRVAQVSLKTGKPLITTECWAIVDYKDYPLLNWNWVKELCEIGVKAAANTQQWVGISTSNFCGPQFIGMWNDIDWHLKLTSIIKSSPISDNLIDTKIVKRVASLYD